MRIQLNSTEIRALMQPQTGSGGFQSLIRALQKEARNTQRLSIDANTMERVVRYAFDYNNGGWQLQLQRVFGRTLWPFLLSDI